MMPIDPFFTSAVKVSKYPGEKIPAREAQQILGANPGHTSSKKPRPQLNFNRFKTTR